MIENEKPRFPADAFAGTAPFYRRYRPPFPKALFADLLTRTGAAPDEALLDLACGPGRVTFGLAQHFSKVAAVDLEPEMIAEGEREAADRCVNHIDWLVGRAEDCNAPAEAFALVTIGDAFHRLDQPVILEKAKAWLRPGGAIAILGSGNTLGDAAVQEIVGPIVEKWTGARPGAATPASAPEHCEHMLRKHGYEEVASFRFDTLHVWSVESILGNFFSTSFASLASLGANADAFAAEIEKALLSRDPRGAFPETLHFGYTFGRKLRQDDL
jgi:ubiquinone/menaquinone biosynthesis C-methylase UbiE